MTQPFIDADMIVRFLTGDEPAKQVVARRPFDDDAVAVTVS